MPTYAELMADGVKGDNGLRQAFPPNTGVGWHTLATGTWPGEHGSTNNTFHRTGEGNFNNRTSFATDGVLQADHIAQAAERAGKTVVAVEWVGARNLVAGAARAGRRLPDVLLEPRHPAQLRPAGAARRSRTPSASRTSASISTPRPGWTNVPASLQPGDAGAAQVTNTAFPAADNVDRFYDLYIYDSTNDCDDELRQRARRALPAGKDGSTAVANLEAGDWAERQGHADRRARRPDRRLLRQGDRDRAGPLAVPHLLHLDRARERDLQRARSRRARSRSPRRSHASSRPRRRPTSRRSRPASSTRTRTSSRA